ncbi:putative HSP20-like chaperone [Lupinus albus]|uniref:Putative HSP20-like chaperone n=1 Tax=Lupinus albus TaxID=3870 RepID=A0A6A4N6F7_LUPAL|nr:putative HSP20-like chaperone [Lupinus albus]
MGDSLLTVLSMENHHHRSTLLSMDSSASSHEELDLEMNTQIILSGPPDINLPLSAERSPPPQPWNPDPCDILDVGLGTQGYGTETFLNLPKPVQHDMENMYMWVFKERPENALGKMQLRSYMNGHSRQGERSFPFSPEKGFVRSHRMQRKHYRGLSNPQCVHGIEVVSSPNLMGIDKDEQKRWMELTGRDLNFKIPPEASDFSSWRNLPNTDFELDRLPHPIKSVPNPQPPKKLLNGSGLNLSTLPANLSNGDTIDLSPVSSKKRKDFFFYGGNDEECYLAVNPPSGRIPEIEMNLAESHWLNDFGGVMKNVSGPVTAAKTIYEDEQGYLIIISLPCVDLPSVKVSWRNTLTHGIIKVSCVSTSGKPFIKRHDRTFKLTDPSPEHCPPGEFVREIPLSTRIPEDANIEAYYDGPGSVLEIMVPKLREGSEEHEVRVCLRPHLGGNDLNVNLS